MEFSAKLSWKSSESVILIQTMADQDSMEQSQKPLLTVIPEENESVQARLMAANRQILPAANRFPFVFG
jgi:hypothetical protein